MTLALVAGALAPTATAATAQAPAPGCSDGLMCLWADVRNNPSYYAPNAPGCFAVPDAAVYVENHSRSTYRLYPYGDQGCNQYPEATVLPGQAKAAGELPYFWVSRA
ncbi:hypothetical protein D5S17_33725 [Pseudonocardiaceae bacterium YIM PH 21723]|nr:hypothetical protein D5S17_33725 [Pseudonocardiaceae bacterium YIM PH 21723]